MPQGRGPVGATTQTAWREADTGNGRNSWNVTLTRKLHSHRPRWLAQVRMAREGDFMELYLLSIARALVEVAGLALLGQGILAVLAGKYRDQNVFYKLFQIVTGPVVRFVRWVTPRKIVDAHIPFVTFFILAWLWIGLAMAKRILCSAQGLAC
jgi:hypothetical protein